MLANRWAITKRLKSLPSDDKLQTLFEDFTPAVSLNLQREIKRSYQEVLSFAKEFKFVKQKELINLINLVIDELSQLEDNKILNLLDIENFEDYYFTHAFNVCILSLFLGLKLGLVREELLKLGLGALLHDIGYLFISEDILRKPYRLSKQELQEVRKHPLISYELMRTSKLPQVSCRIGYEHHERVNKEGYPKGLQEDEIHNFSFITAVCDIYDALTTERPYRRKLSKSFTMKLILSRVVDHLPLDIIDLLYSALGSYPIGSIVRLNTEELGVVIRINEDALDRPVVRVFAADGKKLPKLKDINLKKERYKFIICALKDDIIFSS
jgi:HD-GYP domain-containing protein (c-di-GMP phosphodiesterase class II)